MTKKILLIDDSKTQLYSLKIILSKAGFEVITADNAVIGFEIAYRQKPDLIVSDIVMPSINGYQFCRLLKNDPVTKNIPIVLLTILESKIDKFWGLKAGADKFLNKDSEPEILIEEISKIIKNTSERKEDIIEETVSFSENAYHAKINEILDQSLIESTIMNEFRNISEFITDETKMASEIFMILGSILNFDSAALFFNSADLKKKKKITFCSNQPQATLNNLAKDFFKVILDETLQKEDIIAKSIKRPDEEAFLEQHQTALILPIKLGEQLLGGIGIYSHKKIDYLSQKTFGIILNELKMLMQIKHLHSKTRLLTIIDPLTGLYNRRYFTEVIDREFSRAKRYKSDLSIAMFDIDNFKKINDTYGHQLGDEVLRKTSEIIQKSLRNTDFAFRYGGEEILALLTNSSAEQAFIPIERIREKIENLEFNLNNETIKVTISAGISSIDTDTATSEILTNQADNALYEAKNSGKNKVLLAQKEIIS